MSFFILAMGMMVSAGAPIYKEYNVNKHMNATNESISVAQRALDTFYQHNGYYPCPAARNIAVDKTGFGTATDCSKPPVSGTVSVPGRTIDNTQWKVRIGTLPVRALGLPDSAIVDGWGHLLTYAVTENYALPSTQQADLLHGAIKVEDSNGNDVTANESSAVYVVVAAGQDGRGAYNLQGQQPLACPSSGLAAQNCNDNGTFLSTMLQSTKGTSSFTNRLAFGGNACSLTGAGSGSVGNVTFFVDNSGSMTTRDIKASSGKYISRISAAHQALDTVIPAVINQKASNDPTNLVGVADFSTYCSGRATSCAGNAGHGGCPLPQDPPTVADTQCLYNGVNNSIGYSTGDISSVYGGSTSTDISSGNYQTVSNNLVNTVNHMQATTDTPLYDSMIDTAAAMQDGQPDKPNVLVILSDGGNNSGSASRDSMINTLATKYPNLKVDFVFVGSESDADSVKSAVFGITPQGNQLKGNFLLVKDADKIPPALTGSLNSCP